MLIKILDTTFNVRKNLVILKIYKYDTESEINIAIKADELPQALGIGKPGVVYPAKVIGKICSAVKDKKIDWQTTLDDSVHVTKDEMAQYKECLKNNTLLEDETDESSKIREKIENKIDNLSAFPFEQVISTISPDQIQEYMEKYIQND